MISAITIHFKDGKTLSSKYYYFSFHGLNLSGNVYRYLNEKSVLTVQDLDNPKLFFYYPFKEIEHVEELANEL